MMIKSDIRVHLLLNMEGQKFGEKNSHMQISVFFNFPRLFPYFFPLFTFLFSKFWGEGGNVQKILRGGGNSPFAPYSI